MATNGTVESFAPPDVLAALMTMRGGETEAKKTAHAYLERFQKSVCPSLTALTGQTTVSS